MFDFARYQAGESYGSHALHLGPGLAAQWRMLYPGHEGEDDRVPAGMLCVITMRAYTSLITPRPPGNIHGRQRFDVGRLPKFGERVTTSIHCESKEIRNGRFWVHLLFETLDASGAYLFRGRFVSIVAR